jgi:hypothetical protein
MAELDSRKEDSVEPLVVPLWPDAGKALGLGKNRTYESARIEEIPTLKFERTYRVSRAWLRKVTSGETA